MKKRTVITTEKREVWIIREGTPEPDQHAGQQTAEVPSRAQQSEKLERSEKDETTTNVP